MKIDLTIKEIIKKGLQQIIFFFFLVGFYGDFQRIFEKALFFLQVIYSYIGMCLINLCHRTNLIGMNPDYDFKSVFQKMI